MVTGYYREDVSFRIDFYPNAARLKHDTGVVSEKRTFESYKFAVRCQIDIGDKVQDSPTAREYFNRSLVDYEQRGGKIGYMLGKVLKVGLTVGSDGS